MTRAVNRAVTKTVWPNIIHVFIQRVFWSSPSHVRDVITNTDIYISALFLNERVAFTRFSFRCVTTRSHGSSARIRSLPVRSGNEEKRPCAQHDA